MRGFLLFAGLVPLVLTAQGEHALFEKKIRPLLAERCWQCHSAQAKIVFAGLRLDTRAGAMRLIVPGNAAASRLYETLRYDGPVKMPPTGRLPAEALADVKAWIDAGAAWPEDAPAVAAVAKVAPGLDHWAWKAPRKPEAPAVRDRAWVRDEIDAFVLAKLEANRLRPVADAPAARWLRRVTLDLTGLPPTPEEQAEFQRGGSYEAVVDRLLASPAFGERWGRHWLDQTYYADNIEIGRRVPARHAWRYRDYVIDAINRDVPYPRFVLEQLAGDQLEWTKPEERRRNLVATGFLALGPWPLVNADKEQLRMDVVDLQVDLIGRTFLGLTMGCARCHDHKFDPISLKDYYGMAGILSSTRTLTGRLSLGVFSNVTSVPLPESPEEMTERAEETRRYWKKLETARGELEALREKRKGAAKDSAEAKALDKEIGAATNAVKLLEYLPVTPPTAHAVVDADTPADCAINVRGNAHQLGEVVPRTGVAIAGKGHQLDIPDYTSGRQELARWIGSAENPLTARVMVNRVWHHLFGAGLVPTIDNFGTRGGAVSHPELLDHLALRFVEGGWSLKKLVRAIVLSHTYRLDSVPEAAAMAVDPENRLLWRMGRRRLEAETIRDSMLAASGQLDRRAGGPSLPFYIKGNLNLGQPEFFIEDLKLDPADLSRRAVYLPVLRKSQATELDILNLFNFPDTNQITGARQATTVPTQALYLMNSDFVREQAAALAKLVLAAPGSDEERARLLVRRLYAREAASGETERLLAYVADYARRNSGGGAGEARSEAWKRLCHSLLISNEFLYRS